MSLQSMTNHPFTLVKNNGQRVEFRGLLSKTTLTTFNHTLKVEEGDVVERTLPNGMLERFEVLDTGYHPGMSGAISPNYQMKVQKIGTPISSLSASVGKVTHIYNVSGPNARVNLHSVDSSSNIANIGETELFDKMRSAIEGGVMDRSASRCYPLWQNFRRQWVAKAFPDKFQKLLSFSANAMTVLGPFLPALGQLAASALGS